VICIIHAQKVIGNETVMKLDEKEPKWNQWS